MYQQWHSRAPDVVCFPCNLETMLQIGFITSVMLFQIGALTPVMPHGNILMVTNHHWTPASWHTCWWRTRRGPPTPFEQSSVGPLFSGQCPCPREGWKVTHPLWSVISRTSVLSAVPPALVRVGRALAPFDQSSVGPLFSRQCPLPSWGLAGPCCLSSVFLALCVILLLGYE
jgi:hypothetical protein